MKSLVLRATIMVCAAGVALVWGCQAAASSGGGDGGGSAPGGGTGGLTPVEVGEVLYAENNCGQCHGEAGSGGEIGPPLINATADTIETALADERHTALGLPHFAADDYANLAAYFAQPTEGDGEGEVEGEGEGEGEGEDEAGAEQELQPPEGDADDAGAEGEGEGEGESEGEGEDEGEGEGGCLTDDDCDDGVACTDDSCNETTGSCDNIANDANCDDGLFCNGAETCDTANDCQAGSDPCPGPGCDEVNDACTACQNNAHCDDGLFCNGQETCVAGKCQSGPEPCASGQNCNEGPDSCGDCTSDSHCDTGLFCDGTETCVGVVCQPGTPPDCDDGVACTNDSCNESTDSCNNMANDANCDDGLFCNGAETCDAVNDCQPATALNCDDGVACTDDSCNETTDSCDNIANDAHCPDDALFCNGTESCHPVQACVSSGDPCAVNEVCNEAGHVCEFPTACSDDVDNDGDGLTDLEDCGCTNLQDDDEQWAGQADLSFLQPLLDGTETWINFAPTLFDPTVGMYPSQADLLEDLQRTYSDGFTGILTYELGNTFLHIPSLATDVGFTVVGAGIWDPTDEAEIAAAISVREDVKFYIVGSEGLLRGTDYTDQELLDAIQHVRNATCLPVTTSEPWNVLIVYPDVIEAVDFVGVNIYGFWEGAHEPEAAVDVLEGHYNEVVPAAGGKTLVVRETGFPTGGHPDASVAKQREYFDLLLTAGVPFIHFEAYDQFWKHEWHEGYDIGIHWGWRDADGNPKSVNHAPVANQVTVDTAFQTPVQVMLDAEDEDGDSLTYSWSNPSHGTLSGTAPALTYAPDAGFSGVDTFTYTANDGMVDSNVATVTINVGPASEPSIWFTFVPPIGSFQNLEGATENVNYQTHKVVVYIKVFGQWWVKPYLAWPLTTIGSDGTWTCDITTGGSDSQATEICAYVVLDGYDADLHVRPTDAEYIAMACVER